jgi:quercetin dioxygenase-like cupin family protein
MHHVGRFREADLAPDPTFQTHCKDYTRVALVDHTSGSVHTGLSMDQLAPSGSIDPHVHSHEEGFYIMSGRAVVRVEDQVHVLGPGDYGVFKVGTVHAWRAAASASVRWLQMAAPQPKPRGSERDTFFLKGAPPPSDGLTVDSSLSMQHLLGHFGVDQIPPPGVGRATSGGLAGVFLNWLIDEKFGARHHRLLLIEYQPGVSIGLHDHTFEESYFILSGQVQATLDGRTYMAGAGDVLWTGVGCVHAFANVGNEPVRWLETFAPQPPAENVFRFIAEWDQRARELEG